MGCHSLPIEQGRLARPHVPRQLRWLRRCTFCATCALGDERHCGFDCPHFAGLRLTHAELFEDALGAMKSLVWHKDQQAVCALLLSIEIVIGTRLRVDHALAPPYGGQARLLGPQQGCTLLRTR